MGAQCIYIRIHPTSEPDPLITELVLYYLESMAANLLTSVQDAVKREYDYIVVGAYTPHLSFPTLPICMHVCCNRRWSKYTHVLLDISAQTHARRPQASSSLRVCLRIPQSLCSSLKQDVRISTRTPSVRSPTLDLLFFAHPFPDTRSHVRDVWEEFFQSRFRVGLHDRA